MTETYRDPASEQRRKRPVESPFRLVGQYADEETGLCATRFRQFDPEVGRWLSPDALGFEGGHDVFGFNGSPSVIIDPLGLIGLDEPGYMVYGLYHPGEAVGTIVLVEQDGKTTLTQTILYESREARDVVLKSPMESGMAAGYDRLAQVLASLGAQ